MSAAASAGEPRVAVRGVSRVYGAATSEPVVALAECSVDVAHGAFFAIRGPSGCGKTTLLRLIAALDRPTSGEVLHDGRPLSALSEAQLSSLRRGIGIVFQGDAMIPRLPCWENVAYPLIPLGTRRGARHRAAMAALDVLGIGHLARKAPEELSGGERQRVGVARALVTAPTLVVADEPAAHVDDATARGVLAALREIAAAGGTVIVATHRADLADAADGVLDLVP